MRIKCPIAHDSEPGPNGALGTRNYTFSPPLNEADVRWTN